MQAGRGSVKPPIGVAFEGDVGTRVDAVLGIALLNGLTTKGEARLIATSISTPDIATAQLADVLVSFYTGRPVGGAAMVGMPETGPRTASPPLTAALSLKGPDGTPRYTSNISRALDTADNAVLTRNMLLAQNDANATVVVAGPLTGAARLLGLFGARPQIATKVRHLVVAAGAVGGQTIDPSVAADVPSARAVFADWPTPIVLVGAEVGEALKFPAAGIEQGLAWAPAHPVADVYRGFKPMPYDAPASALAALLYAVHSEETLFKLSEPGTFTVQPDGRTQFAPAPEGRHRYLVVDPSQANRVVGRYRELVAAQPPVRGGGRGRGGPPPPAAAQPIPPAQVPAVVKPPTP